MEAYIAKNNLENVSLLGFVSENEKIKLLQQATVYLATAVYGESFGIVLLEAMAADTPVAGFANDGYKNVITTEMTSYFASPHDVEKLTHVTEQLLSSEGLRHKLTTLGLAEVQKYEWSTLVQQIAQCYEDATKTSEK